MTSYNPSEWPRRSSVKKLTPGNGSEQRAQRPSALIVTIYGLYARGVGGWISVSALIRLMESLGVDGPAVRSSISRLKRAGLLEPERFDGQAGYALSAKARQILDDGDRRIFSRLRATLSDGWVLAVFSVPETERRKRHALRSRLTWLGFGTVGPGVWVAPAHLEAETRDTLEREDLASYVDLFTSTYAGFGQVRDEVRRWWDLEALEEMYAMFHSDFRPTLDTWRRRRGRDDNGLAFADYIRVLTAWRRLPYLDPGLPAEVLDPGWQGLAASDLFFALQRRLSEPAQRHFQSVANDR